MNRPNPSYLLRLLPLFQNESKCENIRVKMSSQVYFHANQLLFSYETFGTKTHFKIEAQGNSEMVSCKL